MKSFAGDNDKATRQWSEDYRRMLLDEVIPFWSRFGYDRCGGGMRNQIDDFGRELGTDKFIWSQGRGLWVFSALINRVERRNEWLEFASHIYEYLVRVGMDEEGRWPYRLNAEGKIIDGPISLYVDGFVIAGLAEYHRATGEPQSLELAMATFDSVCRRLAARDYQLAPYDLLPGLKAHGVAMLFCWVFHQLAMANPKDTRPREACLRMAGEILEDFYVSEKNVILEFVSLDGGFVNSPEGRACVPGHALESLWFLMTIPGAVPENRRSLCLELVKRHLQLGWDERRGGLMLALDIDGGEVPYWKNHDYKPWWVQTEALVATAVAYRESGDLDFQRWHGRIRDFALANYPHASGEWRQWLDGECKPAPSAALPVKDPFHLPRALMVLGDF